MTAPVGAQLYTQGFGSRPENVEIPFYSIAAPSPNKVNFPLGKRWITSGSEYVLTSFSSLNGTLQANWTALGGGGAFPIAAVGNSGPMVTGTVTVSNAAVTSSSVIIFSATTLVNPTGVWNVQSVVPGSFQIVSNGNTDGTSFNYLVINP